MLDPSYVFGQKITDQKTRRQYSLVLKFYCSALNSRPKKARGFKVEYRGGRGREILYHENLEAHSMKTYIITGITRCTLIDTALRSNIEGIFTDSSNPMTSSWTEVLTEIFNEPLVVSANSDIYFFKFNYEEGL